MFVSVTNFMNFKIIIGIIIAIISIGAAIVLSMNTLTPPDASIPIGTDSGTVIARSLNDAVVSSDSP